MGGGVGWVAHVIIESPQSQWDLDFDFGPVLGLGGLDLGLGLDNNNRFLFSKVMTIPPHVLSELMSSVEAPVSISAFSSSSAASRVRIPPPPHRNSNAPPMKSKERTQLSSFRPIEPSVSHQFPSLSLKPIPLSDSKQPRTSSETRIVSSLQTSLPLNVRLNEMSRFVLPQHPLPNVKKK